MLSFDRATSSDLFLLNDFDIPTLFHHSSSSRSYPDISFASFSLVYLAPGRCFRTCVLITTNSTNRPSLSGLSPQRTSPFFEFLESSSRWLCFLLSLSLSFCRGILVSFSFLCCCSLYFSDTECPPYNLMLWTNGSVIDFLKLNY